MLLLNEWTRTTEIDKNSGGGCRLSLACFREKLAKRKYTRLECFRTDELNDSSRSQSSQQRQLQI